MRPWISFGFGLSVLLVTGAVCMVQVSVRADEADELRSRAKMMLQKSAHAVENGQKEEAAELERGGRKLLKAAEELEQENARRGEQEKPGKKGLKKDGGKTALEPTSKRKLDPHERKPSHGEHLELAEVAERLNHARMAVDHLQAAGLADLAKATADRASEMENHLRLAKEKLHRDVREKGPDPRDEALQDLRAQMREIREELQLLRQKLSK